MILGSKKDCNTVYNILNQSERNKHGKITSIDIPKEAENLFWRLIIEFEKLHFEWGDWEIAGSSTNNAGINDIVCGKKGFEHTCNVEYEKDLMSGEEKPIRYYFALCNQKEKRMERIEIPQDISVEYKLLFYYSSSKKEIVIKRNPPILKGSLPKYDGSKCVLKVNKKIIELEPRLLALYVLFLKNPNGIKKREIKNYYSRYEELWEEISKNHLIKNGLDKEDVIPYTIQNRNLLRNLDHYISEVNKVLLKNNVLPLFYIRQYCAKNKGENYFLSFHFLNNDKVKRK